jgi:hypothetical protein
VVKLQIAQPNLDFLRHRQSILDCGCDGTVDGLRDFCAGCILGRWVDEPGKISLKGWAERGVKSLVASVDNVLRGVQLLPQGDSENDKVLGKVTAFEDSREHANLSGNRSRLAALHIGLDDDAWIARRWNNGYHKRAQSTTTIAGQMYADDPFEPLSCLMQ